MIKTKNVLLSILFCCLNAITCAFTLKANIGVGAFDAFSNTLSLISNIKVGYILIIHCGIIFIVNVLILKKDFKLIMALQMGMPTITGLIVNLFYYDLLKFEITSYPIKVITFLISNICSAICVAFLMKINLTNYPLEGLCQTLENKTSKNFQFYRQGADIIYVITSIALCLITKIDMQIREGTIISMLIYAPITSYVTKYLNKKKII